MQVIWLIDQAFSVYMAGYCPSLFVVFGLKVEVHKHAKLKERGQYPAFLTEQALSIKYFLYGCRQTLAGHRL